MLCRMFSSSLSLNSCCVSPGSSQHLGAIRLILGVLDPSLPYSLLCWFATWSIPGGPVGLQHKLHQASICSMALHLLPQRGAGCWLGLQAGVKMPVRTPGLCSYRKINGGEKKYPEPEALLPLLEMGEKEDNIQHLFQPWRNLVLSRQSPRFKELVRKREKSISTPSFLLFVKKPRHSLTPRWRRCPGLSCGKGQAGPAACSCLGCQTHGMSPKPPGTGAGGAEVKCLLAWVMTLISNIQIPGMDSLELAHLELPRAMAGFSPG